MAQVVIIGAGLTGLSTAYFLEQQQFFDYIIFEKELQPGGLCQSIRNDGFTFDYTGHFFHGAQDLIKSIPITNNHHFWQQITREAHVWSHNTYTPYPYQTNLHGLPVDTIIDCIEGFVAKKASSVKSSSFKQWILNNFGTGFANHFFFPYQEKIFNYPVQKLRTGWVGVVPPTTLCDILRGALQKQDIQTVGYNASFLYPNEGGIDHLVHVFHNSLKKHVFFNSSVESINAHKKTVTLKNGLIEHYELLISTMPLTRCLQHLRMTDVGRNLICNSVINFNIGINRPELTNKHWVYYPEHHYPFFRIGFPGALNCGMCPKDHSSLSIEIATRQPITSHYINQLRQESLMYLKKLFNFQTDNIVIEQVLLLEHAYVTYNMWRERNIDKLLQHLASQSIFSVGRYGAWKYSSMHEAINEGSATAKRIISNLCDKKSYTPARRDTPQPFIPAHSKKIRAPSTKEIL